jgi:hypothetical protein
MKLLTKNVKTKLTYLSIVIGGILIFGSGIILGMAIQWVNYWFSY